VPEADTAYYRGGRARFKMDHVLKFLGDVLLPAVVICPYCGQDARWIKAAEVPFTMGSLKTYKYRCTGALEHSVLLWLVNGVYAWR